MSRRRAYFLLISFVFWSLVVWSRFFYWQVVMGNKLARAETQQAVSVKQFTSPRGEIFAADNRPLVLNEQRFDLYVWKPVLSLSSQEFLALVEPIIDEQKLEKTWAEKAQDRLDDQDQNWVLIKRQLNNKQAKQIKTMPVKGLFLQENWGRFYPEGSASAHLLGFLGRNRAGKPKGYFGLEGFYDRQLQGLSRLVMEKRGWWNKIQDVLVGLNEGEKGRDLVLFLDRAVQFVIEEELEKGVEKYGAQSGWVVVLDPHSGGVLGMSAWPSYDPALYFDYQEFLFPNPIIAQHFEPGSIFKPLVVAAALQEKTIKLDDKCSICSGPIAIADYEIETWNNQYYPRSTVGEIIEHSDNVGMVWIGQKLGMEKMLFYLEKLNLGKKTNIDLEEEAALSLKEGRAWYPIDLATASFGQGIALTPLQMTTAFASLANGGNWIRPRVTAKIKEGDKSVETLLDSRKVFDKEVVDEVKKMLIRAVEKGEAQWTRISGLQVAGKTGTAQISIQGHYDKEKTIASFIGFAPANNPRFIMLVSLAEPTSSPWGSETAAPLWFAIAKRLLTYWGVSY